ncbi:TRAM domain-containing protein [Natronomonas sp. LN261]|jgi:predicted RNA-binding protein with TRAM domain|uniref:TRAM domain-containing protein n=1 Tax=Natronomonas sp. LN261 TaxID=2750669 RepID=UPI0015EF3EA4|nr:TRAM domain-containing protein [Natronomonas sp. LN261]
MEISDRLKCLFTAEIERADGSYVIDVPEQEVQLGGLRANDTYRVAILPSPSSPENGSESSETEPRPEPDEEYDTPAPPVEEGDQRRVEIEDIGEQGDGITRVERGFVVIVPDTDKGERVVVEITDVAETVAFGEVVERLSYYE